MLLVAGLDALTILSGPQRVTGLMAAIPRVTQQTATTSSLVLFFDWLMLPFFMWRVAKRGLDGFVTTVVGDSLRYIGRSPLINEEGTNVGAMVGAETQVIGVKRGIWEWREDRLRHDRESMTVTL